MFTDSEPPSSSNQKLFHLRYSGNKQPAKSGLLTNQLGDFLVNNVKRRQSAISKELNLSLSMDDSLLEEQESMLQFHNKSKLSAFLQLFKVSFSKLELAPFSNGQ